MAVSPQEAARRFAEAGSALSSRYKQGATGKGSRWAANAANAAGNYKAGITASLAAGSFEKGVADAGSNAYDEGIRAGADLAWADGMSRGDDKWLKKIQPGTSLWATDLPTPRGARRSGANRARMNENSERFIKAFGKA